MASDRQTNRALQLLMEGFVVVTSILIAFALDAWWDAQLETADLDQELISVQAELAANRDRVEFSLDIVTRMVSAHDEVLARLNEPNLPRVLTIPDTLAALIFTSPTIDPSLGAVEAIITGGHLPDVEPVELRLLLAGLRESFDDAIEDQVTAKAQYHTLVHPLISTVTEFDRWSGVLLEWWSARTTGAGYKSYQSVSIPTGRAFKNALELRRLYYLVAVTELERVDTELRRGIELIQDRAG